MSRKRMMARPIVPVRRSRTGSLGAIAVAVMVIVVGLVAVSSLLADGNGRPTGGSTAVAALPTATARENGPSTATPVAVTARPSRTPTAEPSPTKRPTPTPDTNPTPLPRRTPQPTRTPGNGAPQGAADFDLEGQVIKIGFPLWSRSRYHYRNNFLDTREGVPDAYNHARTHQDGSKVRLHDGTDIYARVGEPLLATFSGTVINPRTRWRPWEPERYGRTIVIVSDEPASAGYTALYVHADRVWVAPGDHVERGQVLGTVGRTGNADGANVPSHLHFELRAPFLLDWSAMGEGRRIDAFNPFPSLVAADPKRN